MRPMQARTPSLIRRTAWMARDWLYAGAWQLRSLAPSSVEDYRSGTRQPVLVLPGVYETWHFMRPLMDALHEHGHPIHVVGSLQHNVRPIPASADLVMAAIEEAQLRDVLLLAHSKGGLIGKYAMERLDAQQRIAHLIAIATPFAGSAYARFAVGRRLRAFRAADPVLASLIRDASANDRVTSLYGAFDTVIPEGSELPGATNVRLPINGHFRILSDPRMRDAVLAAARRVAPDQDFSTNAG